MTRYGSPIICSFGELSKCDTHVCPYKKFFPLGDTVQEAMRNALIYMKNPPNLGTCCMGAQLMLDRYTDRSRDFWGYSFSELMELVPLIIDLKTGEIVSFNDEDIESNLHD